MARSTPRQKSERTEYELVDQLYEANTKVEALLGVKKALEMDVQLYQSDVKALQTELDDARLRVETAEADRNAMRAEHDGLVTQLRALQLAHAGLCAAHAELQIREAHQKEQTGVQAAELLTLQRELTQHRLADSAVEAREASRRLEIAKLRAELAEARERLEQTEACAAAVARAGVDPVTLRANHSEITQATIEILRDQLQSTLTRSAGTGAGLAAAAAATTEGNRAELKVGNGGGAGPMVLGMLLGNLDKGAEIAQHHPDLLDLVQQWAGGGSLPPDKVQATVLKAGLDPEVAQKIQVASVLLSTTDSGGLNPEGLGAILTLASSVDSAQLEQLGITPTAMGSLRAAIQTAANADGAPALDTLTPIVRDYTGMEPAELLSAVAPIAQAQLGFDPAIVQGLLRSFAAANPANADPTSAVPMGSAVAGGSPPHIAGAPSGDCSEALHRTCVVDAEAEAEGVEGSGDTDLETLQEMTGLIMRERTSSSFTSVSPSPGPSPAHPFVGDHSVDPTGGLPPLREKTDSRAQRPVGGLDLD